MTIEIPRIDCCDDKVRSVKEERERERENITSVNDRIGAIISNYIAFIY